MIADPVFSITFYSPNRSYSDAKAISPGKAIVNDRQEDIMPRWNITL
jgi:hypothetical protein